MLELCVLLPGLPRLHLYGNAKMPTIIYFPLFHISGTLYWRIKTEAYHPLYHR